MVLCLLSLLPFKWKRPFPWKMKECWFCKNPYLQNWGGISVLLSQRRNSRPGGSASHQLCRNACQEGWRMHPCQRGQRFTADQTFTHLPHLISPFRESNTVQKTPADRSVQVLCVREGLVTLNQSSLTNLCFEHDLADVWECLGAAAQIGFTYAASVTFEACRDAQKPSQCIPLF